VPHQQRQRLLAVAHAPEDEDHFGVQLLALAQLRTVFVFVSDSK
jgi:TorA maturation chaperone TorD